MKLGNKIIVAFLLLTFALGGTSCKKFLDINSNPTTATAVEPKLLFGYAITSWDGNKMSGDSYIPLALAAQTIASGGNYGWGAGDVYDISVYSLGNTWKMYYSTAGNNLQLAIKSAQSASPVNNNTAAQCKVILAQLAYEAAVLYGDVPFSEAWRDDVSYPHYDAQKDVFEGVIKLLDEAYAQFDEASPLKITDYDVFYSGDIAKWKKLNKSIRFRVLMTMVDKDPTKAAEIGTMLGNQALMISSASDNFLFKYSTATNNENPKYRLFNEYTNGDNLWFFANTNVFDFMDAKNDPRIPRYFDLGPDATDYKAVGSEETADETTSLISAYLYRKNAPSVIFSYQELQLLKAEAYARGLGVTKNLTQAQTLYRSGVEAAMTFYEANATDVQTYLNTELVDLTTAADPVKEIHIQQWIDLMDRPFEAFVQWRRSGPEGNEVPVLTRPPGTPAGSLFRRFKLSPDETAANPNIPNPQPNYYDKVWFDL